MAGPGGADDGLARLLKLGSKELQQIDALRGSVPSEDTLLQLVLLAYTRARKSAQDKSLVRHLTQGEFDKLREVGLDVGSDQQRLRVLQNLGRWMVREYAAATAVIEPFRDLKVKCSAINKAIDVMRGIDVSEALPPVVRDAPAQGAKKKPPTAAERRILRALDVLEAHHVIEERWFDRYAKDFKALGWANVRDVDAIALSEVGHRRSMVALAEALGQSGPLPPGVDFVNLTDTLEHRIRTPTDYANLEPAQKASGLFHEIGPDTPPTALIDAYLDVYATRPELTNQFELLIKPRLLELRAKLAP